MQLLDKATSKSYRAMVWIRNLMFYRKRLFHILYDLKIWKRMCRTGNFKYDFRYTYICVEKLDGAGE